MHTDCTASKEMKKNESLMITAEATCKHY
jgi:hypothetical protein